jgi:hypothetical protein
MRKGPYRNTVPNTLTHSFANLNMFSMNLKGAYLEGGGGGGRERGGGLAGRASEKPRAHIKG